eukprot:GHVR01118528.1.p1 GENE.GHVR01118528.1~~GHVR01118528.1.p1  ORF type:complete len:128 (-),score=16.05 GHVR01118528.1:17-400(-)
METNEEDQILEEILRLRDETAKNIIEFGQLTLKKETIAQITGYSPELLEEIIFALQEGGVLQPTQKRGTWQVVGIVAEEIHKCARTAPHINERPAPRREKKRCVFLCNNLYKYMSYMITIYDDQFLW